MLSVEHGRPVGAGRAPTVRGDPLAMFAIAVLVTAGLLNLWALGQRDLLIRQAISIAAGVVLLVVLRRTRATTLPWLGWATYLLALAMLLAVMAAGTRAYGAQRWLLIGNLVIQPAELAKLGLLLVLAQVLGTDRASLPRTGLALVLAAVPAALVLLQPDLSTALLLLVITFTILIAARVPVWALLPLVGAAAALAPLGLRFLRPYQVARLHGFLAGAHDAGAGWSLLQAHVAIASGGLFGVARQPLHLLLAEYLPARQTDLAYASLVEQWGLLAGAVVLLATMVLVWRLVAASRIARTPMAGLVAAGLAVLTGAEAIIVVGGNLGFLPLAGVPFPFLSYGGTAGAAHLAAVGLVLSTRDDAARRSLWRSPPWARAHPRLIRLLACGVAVQLAALGTMTWQLQAVSGMGLRELGQRQMTRCARLDAARGTITDRHGVPLAVDEPVDQVSVAPVVVGRDPAVLDSLSSLLGTPASTLRNRLVAGGGDLLVKVADTATATGDRVQAARLPGVVITPQSRRTYPFGSLLAPILGFVGVGTPDEMERFPDLLPNQIVGRAGLERQYDSVLRGQSGRECFWVDPNGTAVSILSHQEPVGGGGLRLSIDVNLQREVTAGLAGAIRGNEGAAVVMDARTGQVLAMASLPSYDDNLFGPPLDPGALGRAEQSPGNPMLEHATQVSAPPGSTFKLVVGATDTVYNAIPPGQVIPTGYTFTYGGHTFHGWGPLPPQDLTKAIAWSNDVYFYKLAVALGPDHIHEIGTQLGAGQLTGIDLPGESPGVLGTPDSLSRIGQPWYPGTSVILGIGQGEVEATPLQVARWTAAVTSGRLVTPHLGMSYESEPGSFSDLPQPGPADLPFASHLGPVRDGMRTAVTQGTATQLGIPGSGGKTGTAEDPTAGGTGADAWFTAVDPVDNPNVVATVFVRGGGEGHLVAEPVAKRVLTYYLAHQATIQA